MAWKGMVLILAAALSPLASHAIDISSRYRSPRNPERKVRASTDLIVLHTTEAPAKSSLTKLSDRGEAHYCVTEDGSVYQIVDRDREAFHAGRSMWRGKEDVDKFSIGIECVGYHDKAMSSAQLGAIRELVKMLQKMYSIPDDRVVCHGHVAYGSPNKWHKFKHRGRKRCGMLFAMASVRKVLGLKGRPASDPDVRAGRLKNADEYLAKVLYGRTDTMAKIYANSRYVKDEEKSGSGLLGWFNWNSSDDQRRKPAKAQPARRSTVVSSPKSVTAISAAPPRNIAELKRFGYVAIGAVTKERTALKIAGEKWNSATTYYTIRDKVVPGNQISAAHIEKGMTIWVKK